MSFSRNENWTKTSWMNDMVTSPRFAKDLTSIYADDIIQAVEEEKAFPTISAAIDDLRSRTGLGEAEAINLRKVAAYGIDPKLHNAIENLSTLAPVKVAKLLKAYNSKCVDCTAAGQECLHVLKANARRAIKEVGFEKLAARVDEFNKAAKVEVNKAKWAKFTKKAGNDFKGNWMAANDDDAMVGNPSDFDNQMKRRLKGEPGNDFKGNWMAANDDDAMVGNPSDFDNQMKRRLENRAAWSKIVGAKKKDDAGCSKCDCKLTGKEKECGIKKCKKCDPKGYAKKKGGPATKKAYFQGSDTPVDKIVSNDPDKLGYPGEVGYARQPMAVPVGGDSRDWEQSWFEGAANETQKVMGPKGSELAEKKEWQRIASWKSFMNKKAGGMNPGFQAYLDKKKGKGGESDDDDSKEDSKDDDDKKDASVRGSFLKKAELVFPQEVYSALQQMTGSIEGISSLLKVMIDAIGADEYAGAEEQQAEVALPGMTELIGSEPVAKWLVENVNNDNDLSNLERIMNNMKRHSSSWNVKIRTAALKKHANLLKAANIEANDINQLTERAGERLSEAANVIKDFKNSKDRLSSGDDQFIQQMTDEYTDRLDDIVNDKGLASRIIDLISKSADKAASLIYIIDDLLKYEK